MEFTHQSRFLPLMAAPEFYPHPTDAVRKMETHISHVFLTGDVVYKIKKPVDLGFLDFSSLEKRRRFCEQECLLNRRLSHGVYLEVVPVTFSRAEGYRLQGSGEAVEYAVKMRQLSEENSLLNRLQAGRVTPADLEQVARTLAGFYRQAETGAWIEDFGALATVRNNCEENFSQISPFAGRYLDAREFEVVFQATRTFLNHAAPLFEKRLAAGSIRDCHGDLRLGHVYFEDGIQIIDCIEFNDRFRFSDTAADLAFLIMEMDFYGHRREADQLLEAFVGLSGDAGIFAVIDFYKCYRAMVRVKVSCMELEPVAAGHYRKSRLANEAAALLNLAYGYALSFSRPAVWVVCGMIAAGKSTLAQGISQHLGLSVFSSDRARKELFGIKPEDSMVLPFKTGIYSREASALVYGRLLLLAQEVVKAGRGVILDATFARAEDRREVVRLARDLDAGVVFIDCRAPVRLVRQRLAEREGREGVSDARPLHFEDFKAGFEPLDEVLPEMYVLASTEHPLSRILPDIMGKARKQLRQQLFERLKP